MNHPEILEPVVIPAPQKEKESIPDDSPFNVPKPKVMPTPKGKI